MRRSARLRGDDGTDEDDMDDWSLSAGGSGHGINIVARHVTVVTAKPQSNRHSILKPRHFHRRSTIDRALRQWRIEPISVGEDLRTVDYTTLEDEELPPYYLAGPAPQEAYTMPPYNVRHSRRRFREQQAWARNEQWARNEAWAGGRASRGALPAPSSMPPPTPPCNHPSHYASSRVSTPLPPPPPTPPSASREAASAPLTHVLTYCRPDSCCPKLDLVSLTSGPSTKANVQYQQCPGVDSSKTFLVVPLRLRRKDDEAVIRTAGAVARAVDANSVVVVRQQKKEPNGDTVSGNPPNGHGGPSPSSQHPSAQPPPMPPPPPTPPPAQDRQPPKYSTPQGPLTGGGGGYGYKDVLPPDGETLVGPEGDAGPVTTVVPEILPITEMSASPIIQSFTLVPENPCHQPPEQTTVGTQYSDNETESKSKSPENKHHSECNVSERPNSGRGLSPPSKKTHSQFTISNTFEECSHEELKGSKLRVECCPSVCSSCSSDIPLALPCVYTTIRSPAGPDSKKEDEQKNDDNGQEKITNIPSEMLPSVEDLGPLANALREALRLCTQLQSTCIPESKNEDKDERSPNKRRTSLGGGDSTPQEDDAEEHNRTAEKPRHKIVLTKQKEIIKREFKKSQDVLCKMSSNLQRRHEQLQKMTQLRQLQLDHVIALRKRLQEQQRKRGAKTEKLREVKEKEELNDGKGVDKKEDEIVVKESVSLETSLDVEKKPEQLNMQQEKPTKGEEKREEAQEEKMSEVVNIESTEDEEKKVVIVEDVPEEPDNEGPPNCVESLTRVELKPQSSQSSQLQRDTLRDETEIKKKKKRKSRSPTIENHLSNQSSIEDVSSSYVRPPTPYYPWRSTNRFDKSPVRPVDLEAQHDEDKSRTSPDQNSTVSDTCGEKESSVAEISQLYSSSQSSKEEYKPGTPTMTFFGRLSHLSEKGSTPARSRDRTHERQWIPVHSTREAFPLGKRSSSTFNQSPSRRVIHLTRSSRPSSENSRTLSSRINSSTPISSSILQHTSTENIFQRPPHWPSPFSSEKQSPPHSSVEQLKNFSGANTLSSSSMSSECMLNKRSLDLAPSRRTTPTGLPSQLSVARSTSFEVGVTSTDLLVAEISNEIGSLPPSTDTTISLREAKHLICYPENAETKKQAEKSRLLNVQRGEQIWDQQSKRVPKAVRGGRSKARSRGEGRRRSQMRWLLPPTPPRCSKTVPPTGSQDPQATQPAISPPQGTAMMRSTSRQNGRLQHHHVRGKKHLRPIGVQEKNQLGKSALKLLPQNGNDKWSLRAATTTTMVSGSGRSGARPAQRGTGPRGRSTRPSPSPAAPPPMTYSHSPARVPQHRSSSQPHVERTKERHSLARTSRSSRSPALTPRAPRRRTSSNRASQGRTPSTNGGRCPRGVFARMNTLQELQKRNPTRRLFGKGGIKDKNYHDTLVSNYNDSSALSLSTDGLCAVINDVTKKTEVLKMRPDCGEGSPVSSRSPFRKPEDLISQIMIEASAAANANSSVRSKLKRPRTQDKKKEDGKESAENKEVITVEGGDMKENQQPHSAASSTSGKATSVKTQTSYADLPLQVPTPLKIPGLAGRVRSETEKLLQELIQRNSLRDVASATKES